ncbi:PaaI family thioesterase [Nocardia sp. NPDC004604]|uniref:PaaI family thioesterase n=1 Tax=Nocardia sp. NPDC004604 TaxID=3157013 RepID=UPI0033A3202E
MSDFGSPSPDPAADTLRGGPSYGEFIEQTRTLMDRVRTACPSDEIALATIAALQEINSRLEEVQVDSWSLPLWTRHDLPAQGNITLPPYEILHRDSESIKATVRFRSYHQGVMNTVHGGHIGVVFDEILGMAAWSAVNTVKRTAYLNVSYRAPVPLEKDLQLLTRVEKQEGRKTFLHAELRDGELLCAEADTLFIALQGQS